MVIVLMAGIRDVVRAARRRSFPETAIDAVTISVAYPNASPAEVEKGVILPIEEATRGDRWASSGPRRRRPRMSGRSRWRWRPGSDVREVMCDVKTEVDAITNLAEDCRGADSPGAGAEGAGPAGRGLGGCRRARSAGDGGSGEGRAAGLRLRCRPPGPGRWSPLQRILGRAGPFGVSQVAGQRDAALRDRDRGLRADAAGARADLRPGGRRGAGFVARPAGWVGQRPKGGEFLIRTEARRYSAEEFGEITVVARPDGSALKLRDIATVKDGFEEVDLDVRFDGRPALVDRRVPPRGGGHSDDRGGGEVLSSPSVHPEILPAGVADRESGRTTRSTCADDSTCCRGTWRSGS